MTRASDDCPTCGRPWYAHSILQRSECRASLRQKVSRNGSAPTPISQPSMFEDPPQWVQKAGSGAIEEAFWKFHRAHPLVYQELVQLCRQGRQAGKEKLGIGMLWEVLRWQRTLAGLPDEDETFKLNNNYRSRYARLIMERNPDLDGIFDIRELRAL